MDQANSSAKTTIRQITTGGTISECLLNMYQEEETTILHATKRYYDTREEFIKEMNAKVFRKYNITYTFTDEVAFDSPEDETIFILRWAKTS